MTGPPPQRRPPRRRTQRRDHLDASAIPVELALLERAAQMEAASAIMHKETDRQDAAGAPWPAEEHIRAVALDTTASAFRALAEELHWH